MELATPEEIGKMAQYELFICRDHLRARLGELSQKVVKLRESIAIRADVVVGGEGDEAEDGEEGREAILNNIEKIRALARLCSGRLDEFGHKGRGGSTRGRKPVRMKSEDDATEFLTEEKEEPIREEQLHQMGVGFRDD